MTDDQLLSRIVIDSGTLAGKPVIRGTRLSVEFILNLLGHGATVSGVLDEYPGLAGDDVQACLLFASNSVAKASFMPLPTAQAE